MSATPEILDLYRLAVEMADRISARRGQANQFYLTLETLLLGVPALFGQDLSHRPAEAASLALAGLMISVVWFLQLRSYRGLNKAKFAVINRIEAEHLSIQPFADEWNELQSDPVARWRPRYAELGSVERLVPLVFALLNLVLLARLF